MTETLAHRYSSESTQWELSNKYLHDRVKIIFIILCILVHWPKVINLSIRRVNNKLPIWEAIHPTLKAFGKKASIWHMLNLAKIMLMLSGIFTVVALPSLLPHFSCWAAGGGRREGGRARRMWQSNQGGRILIQCCNRLDTMYYI